MVSPSPPVFTTILATSIHDMKNSLSLVLNTLDDYLLEHAEQHSQEQLGYLQYESRRINNKLIQLLVFYKMEQTGLRPNIEEYSIYEQLEELLLQEQSLLKVRKIEVEITCDEDLMWYFDRDLIMGVLGNALHNAIRHANSRLLISASVRKRDLKIQINDDGAGFPASVLTSTTTPGHGVNFTDGNTGLGLYFCTLIAGLHKHRSRTGRISLSNDGPLGGGCFSLVLP